MASSSSEFDGMLLSIGMSDKEQAVNDLINTVSPAAFGAKDPTTTGATTWGYLGGSFAGAIQPAGTVTLTVSVMNYVVADRATGVVTVGTGTTDWNNTTDFMRLYAVDMGAAVPIDWGDWRSAYAAAGVGGGTWGGITGTLSDQTDLQAALDDKADVSSLATVATSGAYTDLTGLPTLLQISAGTNITLTPNTPTAGITQISASSGGSAVWGGITGTLTSQTDLAAALAAKSDILWFNTNTTPTGTIPDGSRWWKPADGICFTYISGLWIQANG